MHGKKNFDYKTFRMNIIRRLLTNVSIDQITIRKKVLAIHSPTHVEGIYSLRCKVCKDHKSSYKCKECSQIYGKQIVLHLEDCFAAFHKNPEPYLKRKKKMIKSEQINSNERMEIE